MVGATLTQSATISPDDVQANREVSKDTDAVEVTTPKETVPDVQPEQTIAESLVPSAKQVFFRKKLNNSANDLFRVYFHVS